MAGESTDRLAIVCSRWNQDIVAKLLEGAQRAIAERVENIEKKIDSDVYWVSGAFEIPAFARRIASCYSAVICLGVVIKGETDHYQYVAGESARLIAQAAYDTGVPVLYGVLAVHHRQQALKRAGEKTANKGYELVGDAIHTLAAYRAFRSKFYPKYR